MISDLRVPIPAFVGSKVSEHLEVFLKHMAVQAPWALVCFFNVATGAVGESNKMIYVPYFSSSKPQKLLFHGRYPPGKGVAASGHAALHRKKDRL
jgi:hypothetical protein